jgi:hypothetical protein
MVVGYGRRGGNVPRGFYGCLLREPAGHWYCHNISATTLDPPVIRTILQTLAGLTAQAVHDALAQERAGHDQQQRVHAQARQQAEAAVTLAERRYKAVDPDNPLVAHQLERDYEAALRHLEQLRCAQRQEGQQTAREEGPADVQTLLAIAADVHRVWTHPAVTNVERKELLRALLDRVVFEEPIPGVIELTLHWHGGTVSTIRTYRTTAVKYRILDLWHTGTTVKEIVALLNAEGLRTAQQRPWSETAVEYTLYKYARPTARWQAVQHRIRELHGQGLRCGPIAERLNAEGLRVLTNEPWLDNTVGIELQVLGLPKPRKWPPGQGLTVVAARKEEGDSQKSDETVRRLHSDRLSEANTE